MYDDLSSRKTSRLCHGCVLLLEPVAQSLRSFHVLVDASHNAALFPRSEGLALEAIDAVVETPLDKVRVHLMSDPSALLLLRTGSYAAAMVQCSHIHELLHLLLLHAVLQLALFCGSETAVLLVVAGRTKD